MSSTFDDSLEASPARRALSSITRSTAERSSGRSARSLTRVADQARVERLGAVAVDLGVEVGGHLEQLVEVGVVLGEQVVELRLADEDHLDVERHRLGLERDGGDQAQRLRRRLDADFAAGARASSAS